MIKFKKNTVFIWSLMSLSVLFLVAFQIFWIWKVYQEQFELLKKETDTIFHKTLAKLQDQLMQKNLQPWIQKDSSHFFKSPPMRERMRFRRGNRFKRIPPPIEGDRIVIENKFPENKSDTAQAIQIFVYSKKQDDSLDKFAAKSVLKHAIRQRQPSNFTIQLNGDSLKPNDVKKAYQKALQKEKINLNFELKRLHRDSLMNSSNSIQLVTTEFFYFPFRNYFVAYFPEYQGYLWKKILPSILFSVFLLGLTITAFYWIYRSLQQQKRLTELKNDFISNVTHELKTPVTTVSVAIEALNNFNVLQNPDLAKEYLEISKIELNRLAILVDKILKTTIFERKGIELNWEKINLKDLIHQILNALKLQFEKHQAKVQIETKGSDFWVLGDSLHLTNVIYNMIDNALKYSTPNPPQIQLLLTTQQEKVILAIKDDGIGIPKEYQAKIFDKFFRVPSGNIHTVKGYGLGLNYVKNVVLKHKGNIKVESELGKGSCFYFYFPKTEMIG